MTKGKRFVNDKQRRFVMRMFKKKERDFFVQKLRKNIREGRPKGQAAAIAFSQTRKKFGIRFKVIRSTHNPPPEGSF